MTALRDEVSAAVNRVIGSDGFGSLPHGEQSNLITQEVMTAIDRWSAEVVYPS